MFSFDGIQTRVFDCSKSMISRTRCKASSRLSSSTTAEKCKFNQISNVSFHFFISQTCEKIIELKFNLIGFVKDLLSSVFLGVTAHIFSIETNFSSLKFNELFSTYKTHWKSRGRIKITIGEIFPFNKRLTAWPLTSKTQFLSWKVVREKKECRLCLNFWRKSKRTDSMTRRTASRLVPYRFLLYSPASINIRLWISRSICSLDATKWYSRPSISLSRFGRLVSKNVK